MNTICTWYICTYTVYKKEIRCWTSIIKYRSGGRWFRGVGTQLLFTALKIGLFFIFLIFWNRRKDRCRPKNYEANRNFKIKLYLFSYIKTIKDVFSVSRTFSRQYAWMLRVWNKLISTLKYFLLSLFPRLKRVEITSRRAKKKIPFKEKRFRYFYPELIGYVIRISNRLFDKN